MSLTPLDSKVTTVRLNPRLWVFRSDQHIGEEIRMITT